MLAKLIADDLLSDENGAEVIAEINKAVDMKFFLWSYHSQPN